MKLEQLSKIKLKSSRRVGRGIGSGKGKTAGRGTKGQKARGKIRVGFIGGSLSLYRKLPLKKGKGNSKVSQKPVVINLSKIDSLKDNTQVDIEELLRLKLISKRDIKKGVKILGTGSVTKKLTIKLPASRKAEESIKKVGGSL